MLLVKKDNKLRTLYTRFAGHQRYTRFAIIGHPRTGSNFVFVGLNKCKDVQIYHEIFAKHNRIKGETFEQIFNRFFDKQPMQIKVVGCKIFYEHFTKEEWVKFCLKENFKIIHLLRNNKLRTITSLDIAYKTDEWSLNKELSLRDKKIMLDTTTIMKRLESIEYDEQLIRNYFANREYLEVSYEELIDNPSVIFNKISKFLNISCVDINAIDIKKQNPEMLKDLIENYDHIAEKLKNTKYERYLY